MQVTFIGSQPVAKNIQTFTFKPESRVQHTAGQFIQLTLEHTNPDDRGIKRWFTVSSSPTEENLSITTKHATGQVSTFKQALWTLEPGAKLEMVEPDGDFVLPADKSKRLVFVAGGIGVTPYHSIIQWLSDTGEKRNIKLLYAAKSDDELIFMDLFKSYGMGIVTAVGDSKLTSELILEEAGDLDNTIIYVSGPEPMVEQFDKELIEAGIPRRQLKGDYFPGYDPF